jgi:hypothetical protein
MLALGPIPARANQLAQACIAANAVANAAGQQWLALVQNNWGAYWIWFTTGVDLLGFAAAHDRAVMAQSFAVTVCSAGGAS